MSLLKAICGAAVATVMAAAPAAADYTILHDPAFPSVIYIEFEGSAAPRVISAPSGEKSDPALPRVVNEGDQQSSSSGSSDKKDTATASTGSKSVEQRVMDKVAEIEASAPDSLEDIVIDNQIENEVLDNFDLR